MPTDNLAPDLRLARKLAAKAAWSAKDLATLPPAVMRLANAWSAELDERYDPQGAETLLAFFFRALDELLASGRAQAALPLVDRLRALAPAQGVALAAARAQVLAALGRRDEAVAAIAAVLAAHPDEPFVHEQAAETYTRLADWENCVEHARWLLAAPYVAFDVDSVAAWYANALAKLGWPEAKIGADLNARLAAWQTPAPRTRSDGSRDWIPYLLSAARLPDAPACAAALHALAPHRGEVVPDLVRLLSDAAALPERYFDEPAMPWAVMLLGDLDDARGLEALRALLRLPGADLDALFGDTPLELFPYAAASLAASASYVALLQIADDAEDEYMASIPITAVEVAAARGALTVPQALALLAPLYEEFPDDDLAWFAVAEALVALGSKPHYDDLLADLPRLDAVFGPYSRADLDERYQPDPAQVVGALRADNRYWDHRCVDALAAWSAKQGGSLKFEGRSLKPAPKNEPVAGRNDPCPCGSGRKFKKCCMG